MIKASYQLVVELVSAMGDAAGVLSRP